MHNKGRWKACFRAKPGVSWLRWVQFWRQETYKADEVHYDCSIRPIYLIFITTQILRRYSRLWLFYKLITGIEQKKIKEKDQLQKLMSLKKTEAVIKSF